MFLIRDFYFSLLLAIKSVAENVAECARNIQRHSVVTCFQYIDIYNDHENYFRWFGYIVCFHFSTRHKLSEDGERALLPIVLEDNSVWGSVEVSQM